MTEDFEDPIRTTRRMKTEQSEADRSRGIDRADTKRKPTPRGMGVVAVAALVAVAAGVAFAAWDRSADDDEQIPDARSGTLPGSTPPVPTTEPEQPIQTLEDTAPTTPPMTFVVGDPSNSLWFRSNPGGIFNNEGSLVFPPQPRDPSGPMVRQPNGDIFLLREDTVFVLRSGATDFEQVDLPTPAIFIDRTIDGQAVWWDSNFEGRTMDNVPVEAERIPFDESITAANGYEARLIEPVLERRGRGWVTSVREPARVQIVSPSGDTVADFEVSGAAATTVLISDFDGQRLIVSRQAYEPVLGPIDNVFVDLSCRDGCVELSLGEGQAVWNTRDTQDAAIIAVEEFDLCPAVSDDFDPEPPAILSRDAVTSFEYLVLAARTCDKIALYPGPEVGVDWPAVAEALASEPEVSDQAATFASPSGDVSISIDPTGVYTWRFRE